MGGGGSGWGHTAVRLIRRQTLLEADRLALGAAEHCAVAHDDAAADDGDDGPAGDHHAVEGRPAGFGRHQLVLDPPAPLQIDHGHAPIVAALPPALAAVLLARLRRTAEMHDDPR